MKVFVAALTAMAVMSASAPALAAPVEQQFAHICLAAPSLADATARARAQGYVSAPPAIREKLKGFPNTGEVLWRAGEGEMDLFIAATTTRRLMTETSAVASGDMCVIASMPSQPDLQTKMERMLDVGRAQPFGNDSAYVFELTDNGPARLDASDKALLTTKMVQGVARMAAAMERREASGMMLMIPTIRANK